MVAALCGSIAISRVMGRRVSLMRPPAVPPPDSPERQHPTPTDTAARIRALAVRAPATAVTLPSPLMPNTRGSWAVAAPVHLVLGSGFMAMFEHFGRVRALRRAGVDFSRITGLSAGAMTGAMVACLSLQQCEEALLGLSLCDFLDVSWTTLWRRGAICRTDRLDRKLADTLAPSGLSRLEEVGSDGGPSLQVAVFSTEARATQYLRAGPLVRTVVRSAQLPGLFADDGFLDGAWIDHHGLLALTPGEQSITSRIDEAVGASLDERDPFERALGRPDPIFRLSDDPEHRTLVTVPRETVGIPGFLVDIDFRRAKLARIVDAAEQATYAWLTSPA